MSINPFFQANAINTFKSVSFKSNQTLFQPSSLGKKIKRISSLSSVKLNPQKFTLRQAFNNKIYPQKMFNISVDFNKQQPLSNSKNSFKLQNLQTHFRTTTKQQFKKLCATFQNNILNLTNFFKNIQETNKKDQIAQNQLFLLKETIQKIMKMISKQFVDKQSRCTELLFKNKMQSSRIVMKQSKLQHTNSSIQNQDFKKYNLQKKVKDLTQKLKKIQFQNSKLKLQCENLTNNIQSKNSQFVQVCKQNSSMKQRLRKVKQGQQFLEYKIKKLKQQLQVAHIVKQQNLAQKMKFIMNFQ